jgi:tRNA(Arg) A34 adenosine deaminase TadA
MDVSAEPCARCVGSLYWAGIGRLVHAMSEYKPCRIIGPLLEEDNEAAALHDGIWQR